MSSNLIDKIKMNQNIEEYYRLEKLRTNAINRYKIYSNASDELANITDSVSKGESFIGDYFLEPFATVQTRRQAVGRGNLDANFRTMSSPISGEISLQMRMKQNLENQLKKNTILKNNIYKNINLYEKDFITEVDNLDKNNKKIMNMDRLIQENEYASTQKDKDIFILKSYFSALILIIVLGLFYITGIISPKIFFYIIIIIIILTTVFVIYKIYSSNRENKIRELSELSIKTAKKLEKEGIRLIAPLLKIEECPKNRKCKKEKLSEPIIINPNSVNIRAPQVRRDQPDIPFKDGIKSPIAPSAANCNNIDKNDPNYNIKYNECIERIKPNNPVSSVSRASVYTCKWNGNPDGMLNSNLGKNVKNIKYFNTYIPCQYYPGYNNADNADIKYIKDNNITLPFDN
jgi:hypothetical protein